MDVRGVKGVQDIDVGHIQDCVRTAIPTGRVGDLTVLPNVDPHAERTRAALMGRGTSRVHM